MTFNFKSELFKNILPRVNDLERIIANTPEDLKNTPLYEGAVLTLSKLLTDLEKMGVKKMKKN